MCNYFVGKYQQIFYNGGGKRCSEIVLVKVETTCSVIHMILGSIGKLMF